MFDDDKELEKIRQRKLLALRKESLQKKGGDNKTQQTTSSTRSEIIHLTDRNFSPIMDKSDKIFLIDFWAEWCGPCKMMTIPFKNLSFKYPKIQFCKMNIDQNKRIAIQYNIQSIPRFVFFKNKRPVHQVVGAVGERGLDREIQRILAVYPDS